MSIYLRQKLLDFSYLGKYFSPTYLTPNVHNYMPMIFANSGLEENGQVMKLKT